MLRDRITGTTYPSALADCTCPAVYVPLLSWFVRHRPSFPAWPLVALEVPDAGVLPAVR
jgi:hypothetical protein